MGEIHQQEHPEKLYAQKRYKLVAAFNTFGPQAIIKRDMTLRPSSRFLHP